jgi:hypothetical protein
MRTAAAALLLWAGAGPANDPADAFRVPFALRPIRHVERTRDDQVVVTYLSGESLRATKSADFSGSGARLEVFTAGAPGMNLSAAEPNSFLTQIVVVLRPAEGARRWVGRQAYADLRIEIDHAEPGTGRARIGPKPLKDKERMPRLDTVERFRPEEFKEIEAGSNRWIWVDTPRLPAVAVPPSGLAYAQSPAPSLASKVRVHPGETLRLRRRFATFFQGGAAEALRIDWSQEVEVRVASRREDWRGTVAAAGPVRVTRADRDEDLARAIRNGTYAVDDGQNELLGHPCFCETVALPRDP